MRTALAALLALAAAADCAAAPRAVWMWEKDSYALLEDRGTAAEAVSFLKAKGIDTVYLYADCYGGRCLIQSKPRLYRRLIRRFRKSGLRAYALLGSAYLKTEEYVLPHKRADALAMLRRVLEYNAGAAPAERFDGVNLDIEPHLLPAWKENREELLLGFLDMSADLMELKRASGQRLQVGPAMPFWFDGIPLKWRGSIRPASEHALDVYDCAALMSYRDRAEGRDGIVALSESELDYAAGAGKKVAIGVETTPNDIRKVSFNHLSEADLERELAEAEEAFGSKPAFDGFVIHHYSGYRKWLGAGLQRKP